MGRSDIFRTSAIIILIAAFVAALVAIHRRPASPPVSDSPSISAPDDLTVELRHCSALGPQDAEDMHCQAVWEENRARFFGRPARSLPTPAAPDSAAPVTPATTNAMQGDKR